MKKFRSTLIHFTLILLMPIIIFAVVPPLFNEHNFELFNEKLILPENENKETISKTKFPSIRSLIPSYYKIQIKPLFDPIENITQRFTVPGSVVIWVDCVETTNTIVLNTNLINVNETSIKVFSRENYKEIPVISQTIDPSQFTYIIHVRDPLQYGHNYEIRVEFIARVFKDRLNGLYLSNYTDPNSNQTKYLATTQFEPYGARQLFPCFDEPDLKAIFDISVGRREKYNTLSNMNIYKTEAIINEEGWYWDHYNSTVKMSTYLVAVIVSEFTSEIADVSLFGGRPVKIWGPKYKIDRKDGVFAATTVAKILQFYEDYFQISYPLPKMDSAEIPHFEAGAMENYGLNTYREQYLLYNSNESTEALRYQITTIIAHELAHQWFGDFVTTKTWPHIWLNEGLASYIEVLGTEAAYPEFETWKLFVPNTLQLAFQFDQSPASHPILDITYDKGRFDRITYKKGSSLIRMMRRFLGEATLKAGLKNYLNKFSFGNTYQNDLFDAIQETAQMQGTFSNLTSINEIMNSWTLQKGFPLVRVSLADSNRIYLTQEQFFEKNFSTIYTNKELDVGKQSWWVPVNLVTKSNSEIQKGRTDFWIPKNVGTLLKSHVNTSGWLIINPDAEGYYRVLYDDELTKRIKTQLESNHKIFSSNKRSQLLDDYFNFAWSDYVRIELPLEFTSYLCNETELSVWTTTFRHFSKTFNLFSRTEAFDSFRNYFLPKVSKSLSKIGLENKPNEKGASILLRSRLIDWACAMEDPECLRYSVRVFQNWVATPSTNSIPNEVRSTIFCSAIAGLDESGWNVAFELYKSKTLGGIHKNLLLKALSCSKNSNTLNRLLETSLDPNSGIEKTDVAKIIQNVFSNSIGGKLALDFINTSFLKIIKYLNSSKPLGILFDPLSKYLHSEQHLNSIQDFFSTHSNVFEPDVHKTINSTIESIRQNKAWMDKHYTPMKLWFERKTIETYNSI